MTRSKGPQGVIEPGASAARTPPLYTRHLFYQLSHQGAPDIMLQAFYCIGQAFKFLLICFTLPLLFSPFPNFCPCLPSHFILLFHNKTVLPLGPFPLLLYPFLPLSYTCMFLSHCLFFPLNIPPSTSLISFCFVSPPLHQLLSIFILFFCIIFPSSSPFSPSSSQRPLLLSLLSSSTLCTTSALC